MDDEETTGSSKSERRRRQVREAQARFRDRKDRELEELRYQVNTLSVSLFHAREEIAFLRDRLAQLEGHHNLPHAGTSTEASSGEVVRSEPGSDFDGSASAGRQGATSASSGLFEGPSTSPSEEKPSATSLKPVAFDDVVLNARSAMAWPGPSDSVSSSWSRATEPQTGVGTTQEGLHDPTEGIATGSFNDNAPLLSVAPDHHKLAQQQDGQEDALAVDPSASDMLLRSFQLTGGPVRWPPDGSTGGQQSGRWGNS